jgi:hypothetical protein
VFNVPAKVVFWVCYEVESLSIFRLDSLEGVFNVGGGGAVSEFTVHRRFLLPWV